MYRATTNPSTVALRLILLATAAFAGCHSAETNCPCNDITPGAIPQPAGTYVCQWNNAEMARAEQDYFVIFKYEWAASGDKLSPFGQEHITRLAQKLAQVPFPIVIEASPDERVNAARKTEIVSALANCHVEITSDRVVLGRSEAEGLYGEEATGIAASMLNSRNGGQGVGAGFGGSQGGTFGASQGGLGTQGSIGSSTGVGVGVY